MSSQQKAPSEVLAVEYEVLLCLFLPGILYVTLVHNQPLSFQLTFSYLACMVSDISLSCPLPQVSQCLRSFLKLLFFPPQILDCLVGSWPHISNCFKKSHDFVVNLVEVWNGPVFILHPRQKQNSYRFLYSLVLFLSFHRPYISLVPEVFFVPWLEFICLLMALQPFALLLACKRRQENL